MPSLGVPELLILLVIIVLIFGAGKLPEIGGAIGRSITEFKDSVRSGGKDDEELEANAVSTDEAVSDSAKS